ncbi:MAG: hypothetical protein R3F14_25430 [Polyangiaceae bacterium]
MAGAGSRFEHYERMPRVRLPSHFIVYPEWFGCEPLLGRALFETEVEEQSILGGDAMVAFVADLDALGSGALPLAPPRNEERIDEVDVADLVSEEEHGFALDGAWASEEVVREIRFEGRTIVDGGRSERRRDAFWMSAPGRGSHLVMRVGAAEAMTLEVRAGGELAGTVALPAGFSERGVRLPAQKTRRTRVQIVALGEALFESLHYWLYVEETSGSGAGAR